MNEIFIIIGLILLNGMFSMSEVAMISARKSRLSTEAKKGSKAAQKALDLSGNPDKFLSTVQIGITLIGILTGIYSGNQIAVDLTDLLKSCGISAAYAAVLAQAIIVVLVIAGLLGTSRIFLKRHTPMQVYAGFCLGFICTFVSSLMSYYYLLFI